MFEGGPNDNDDDDDDGMMGNKGEYVYRCLGPLKEVAHMLAQYDGWSPLYDIETLRRNRVPCAAIVYWADIFVERSFSEETAGSLGGNFRCWMTNEYAHSGIRDDGFNILGKYRLSRVDYWQGIGRGKEDAELCACVVYVYVCASYRPIAWHAER